MSRKQARATLVFIGAVSALGMLCVIKCVGAGRVSRGKVAAPIASDVADARAGSATMPLGHASGLSPVKANSKSDVILVPAEAELEGRRLPSSLVENGVVAAGQKKRQSVSGVTGRGWRRSKLKEEVELKTAWVIPVENASLVYDDNSRMLLIQSEGGPVQVYNLFGEYQKTIAIGREWRLLGTARLSGSKVGFDSRRLKELVMARRTGQFGAFGQDGRMLWALQQAGVSSIRAADLDLNGVDELLVVANEYSVESRSDNSTLLAYSCTGELLWRWAEFDGVVDEVVAGDLRSGGGLEYAAVYEDGGVIVGNENGILKHIAPARQFNTSTIELIRMDSDSEVVFLTLGYRSDRDWTQGGLGKLAASTGSGDAIWEIDSGWLSPTIRKWRRREILGDTENPLNACDASFAVSSDYRWAAMSTGGRGEADGLCLIDLHSGKVAACREWNDNSQADYYRWGNLVWGEAGEDNILVVSTGVEVVAYQVY